ncbi:MAG TPA: hypothetical protein VNZ45_08320 [Bacteroidia bacterium]|jgi:hypothetical protein|nr:hypothetical protein [Bacteroidia bacterium]
MKQGENKEQVSVDLNKLVEFSKMWVMICLDEKGLHFHSSTDEEGIVLMALTMSSNEEIWKTVKEYTEQLRLKKQKKQN